MNRKSSNAALAILLAALPSSRPRSRRTQQTRPRRQSAIRRRQYAHRRRHRQRQQRSRRNFQVLQGDDKSATLAELWASRNSGGAKLSHHWTSGGAAVNKLFAAYDQGDSDLRKATLGGGQNTNAGSGTLTPAKACRVPPSTRPAVWQPPSPKPAAKPGAHTSRTPSPR